MKHLTLLLFLLTTTLLAQSDTKQLTEYEQFLENIAVPDELPSFPGGTMEMMKFINQNINYPLEALQQKNEGRVVLSFVVEKDGSLSNIEILRDPGGGCGEEAVRVLKLMPAWLPGMKDGKPVRVNFKLPVRFKL